MKNLSFLIKAALLSAFIAFTVSTSFAQTVAWDSTYRPKSYPDRIKTFSADPISKKDIVFLGNSITAQNDWAKLLNNPHAKQRGISGDITFGVLDRLDEIIASKPKKIFVLIGINDISRNIPDSIITKNHKLIVQRIRKGSPRTHIYFNTLMPVNASFKKFMNHYGKDEHILAVNEGVRQLAGKKVTVIDLYSYFLDPENHLIAKYSVDGLHLNAGGYQHWKELLEKGRYLN
ncbi:MAG: lipolytic protein family [Sphingobacteriaceae bacterium]|jgi:lysophospholipase L1-like esterase|nr:lipolytic protein family [Sphingobacteriaceae bacterium]